ncbi:very short patch repair endonuclease [Polycyclovorans algicola]|uniref:very short patch repair endonuclease n=1 Tax=Polycyclovorans algicola TaxID=616992 RepID=UPI0004A73D80
MADIVSVATRSRMMSGIRSRNTAPELMVRRGLHAHGYRYRLHVRELPGSPDIVLPKWKTVLFVNGCFWHGHPCHLFRLPATRQEWWQAKIETNRKRDARITETLSSRSWKILTVWECAIRGRTARGIEETVFLIDQFVRSNATIGEVSGK